MKTVQFELNGNPVSVDAHEDEPLLWVIRQQLGLTGTKFGCGAGFCGSCTVILNGEAVRSCILPTEEASGAKVLTIEGLRKNGELHPLQEEFVKSDALQCGFCTPGMIMASKAFLDDEPSPTREEVKEAITGNLCRCTGYVKIIDSVIAAAEDMAPKSIERKK